MPKLLGIKESNETDYTVRRLSNNLHEIASFEGHKHPENLYRVRRGRDSWHCDCMGYRNNPDQNHKHIKLVKHHIKKGEPGLTSYKILDNGKITSKKFG